jgi:AcrR family transcriptional regulator
VSRSTARARAKTKKPPYHHGDLKNALIEAGVQILSTEGLSGLSLRKVALKAGVSYQAPYSHFADKQALIAAISTEGYHRLYDAIRSAAELHDGNPPAQLIECAWAYVSFALEDRDHFKLTMSGALEKEADYPAFVEMSQQAFALVLGLVEAGQESGILRPGPADLAAVSLWSMIHGLVSLLLERQISHTVLDRFSVRELLVETLNQLTTVDLRAAESRLAKSAPRKAKR